MEQYIDEFGNLQFRAVGPTNEYPFKSMVEMANDNALAINNQFPLINTNNTQSGFATNFPFKPVPVSNNIGVTQSNVGNQVEAPYEIIAGQKIYIGDEIGKQAALEKANFYQEPQGILSQAKNFITDTLPRTLKGGLDTLSNFIPGMRFIKGLDKFDTLPYQDRKFITSVMDMKGIPGSGIYVDPGTGLIKDIRGKNVRSLRGNYADNIEQGYLDKVESLQKSKDRWTEKFGDLNNTNNFGKTWAEMNKRNLNEFDFLTSMKAKFDKQKADLREKIKKTKSINIHGGPEFTGLSAAELSEKGRRDYTGPGKAFAPRTDTFTGGKTVKSSSTPGGYYSSPK